MASRSEIGWRNTMSMSLLSSRNCSTVEPTNKVRIVCAIDWLVTPNSRALAWSTSKRMTLTFSFQLSLVPRVDGLARMAALTSSAWARSIAGSGPITRNCTGYGTGGPLGKSLTRARASGNSCASMAGKARRKDSRRFKSAGTTMSCETLVCGNTWSKGK